MQTDNQFSPYLTSEDAYLPRMPAKKLKKKKKVKKKGEE